MITDHIAFLNVYNDTGQGMENVLVLSQHFGMFYHTPKNNRLYSDKGTFESINKTEERESHKN